MRAVNIIASTLTAGPEYKNATAGPKCRQTEKIVKAVVQELDPTATVEKVTDIMEIAGYGVFGTPAVVVDGEVKSVGKIPKAEEIKSWISA